MDGESDVGVGHAAALIAFADAAIARDNKALAAARTRLVAALGEPAMADAAAVIAGFDGITRIADATGIPLEPPKAEQTADLRGDLRIDAFVDAKW
jgi:hypothetical protein